MSIRTYTTDDGRTLCVTVELDSWSVWLDGEPHSHAIGWPLEDLVAEAIGIDVVHDDIPRAVSHFARRIRDDFPRAEWPAVPRV